VGIVEQVSKFLVSETVTPEVHLKNIFFQPQTEGKKLVRPKNYLPVELNRSASQDQSFPQISHPKMRVVQPFLNE
jgi:hypothetical protein